MDKASESDKSLVYAMCMLCQKEQETQGIWLRYYSWGRCLVLFPQHFWQHCWFINGNKTRKVYTDYEQSFCY